MSIRFREDIYQKLKDYAGQEQMTIMGAIRYIIVNFFRNRK